jgi:hypothetical protein
VSADGDEQAVQAIEQDIRRYIAAHSGAGDSIEGIHRWWLSTHLAREPVARLRLAIERLVQEGVLVRRVLPDGRELYAATRSGAGRGH